MIQGLILSLFAFEALNADSMFNPEMIAHMKQTNSYLDLKDGLASGKIDQNALLKVASEINLQKLAEQEYKNLTLYSGNFLAPGFGSGFRIGTVTCDFTSYIFGFGGTFEVKTKNLLIATVVAIALGVAYKKGYLEKLKNYFIKSSEHDEND